MLVSRGKSGLVLFSRKIFNNGKQMIKNPRKKAGLFFIYVELQNEHKH